MPKHTVTAQISKVQRLVCAGDLDLELGSAPEVMTGADVAGFLRITIDSLYTNLWRYSIPHKRFGKRVLFVRTEIHRWITGPIEERVWIDPYKFPTRKAEYWVRETLAAPCAPSSKSNDSP